jgi:HSP20 family protein
MQLIHRERGGHVTPVERPEPADWFRLDVPALFRRMFDEDLSTGWMPVEEFVDGTTLVVRAELPDIDPDKDVELMVEAGVLRIHAQREVKAERTEQGVYRSEFRYGSFDRSVVLPEGVDAGDITAGYTNGILEIRVPLPPPPEKPPATKVPVTQT